MTISREKITKWSRILFWIYIAAMLVVSLGDFNTIGDINLSEEEFGGFKLDKISHCIMFLPFPILAYFGFHKSRGKVSGLILYVIVTLAVAAALAWGIEVAQGWTGYRTKNIRDFIANMIGTAAGIIVMVQHATITKEL